MIIDKKKKMQCNFEDIFMIIIFIIITEGIEK